MYMTFHSWNTRVHLSAEQHDGGVGVLAGRISFKMTWNYKAQASHHLEAINPTSASPSSGSTYIRST